MLADEVNLIIGYIFIFLGIVSMLFAVCFTAIGYKVAKTAAMNPVDSLKEQ